MDPAQDIDHRLTELEIKASFTEDLLEQLNHTVFRQQEQIERLLQQLSDLQRQLPEAGAGGPRNLRDELPPHY